MSPREPSDARLRRLLRDLDAGLAAMEKRAQEIALVAAGESDPATDARLAVALHHYYCAFEGVIERALRTLEGEVPTDPDWHHALLVEATRPLPGARPALIGEEVLADLGELLRFRHFFRHAYAVTLDRLRLDRHAVRVATLHPRLAADLRQLRAEIQGALERLLG